MVELLGDNVGVVGGVLSVLAISSFAQANAAGSHTQQVDSGAFQLSETLIHQRDALLQQVRLQALGVLTLHECSTHSSTNFLPIHNPTDQS